MAAAGTWNPEQAASALERANEIRVKRAQLKRDIHADKQVAVEILLDPPEWCRSMKVTALLTAIPQFGQMRVDRVMRASGVPRAKRLGKLSVTQRLDLVDALPGLSLPESAQ